MREIKFRGQCVKRDNKTNELKQDGKEIIGWLQNIGKRMYIGGYVVGDKKQTVPYVLEVAPETVGQYTGFKDAVGQEMYEGDVLTRWYVFDVDNPDLDEYRIEFDVKEGCWEIVYAYSGMKVEELTESTARDYAVLKGRCEDERVEKSDRTVQSNSDEQRNSQSNERGKSDTVRVG